jgi:GNAT superfamily N-acetyltransferase
MGSTDALAVRDLGPGDLPAAVALSAQVGWNQVEADWRLFLDLGHAVGVDAASGGLAATAATLSSGPGVGWVSMVIVRPDHRRRGIATRLLERCATEIEESGRTPGLDATPAGREVYLRLGFRDSRTLARWRRKETLAPAATEVPGGVRVRALTPGDVHTIARLDRDAFGLEREPLLSHLAGRSSGFAAVAERAGSPSGFLLGRDGRTATHLGPLVAPDPDVARALARHALERVDGGATIDVNDAATDLVDWLTESGFERERPFTRMHRGPAPLPAEPGWAVAIAGPELG